MEKDFDRWNKLKKKIDNKINEVDRFPMEGGVWMCNIGKNIGFEQDGNGDDFSRPILIIKKFNNQMFWSVPLSSKQKDFDFYFNFTDPYNGKVSVILAQLKLISVKRLRRNMYDIDNKIFIEIRNRLKSFL